MTPPPQPQPQPPFLLLPREIYHQIFSHLPREDQLSCRLLDGGSGSGGGGGRRSASAVATALAFRRLHLRLRLHLGLRPARDGLAAAFEAIARAPHLRDCVRELTVDAAWLGFVGASLPLLVGGRGAAAAEAEAEGCAGVASFLVGTLPCARFFAGLSALHLRFGRERGGKENRLRYWVLRVVFESLAGEWWDGGGVEQEGTTRGELLRYCREEWGWEEWGWADDDNDDDDNADEGDERNHSNNGAWSASSNASQNNVKEDIDNDNNDGNDDDVGSTNSASKALPFRKKLTSSGPPPPPPPIQLRTLTIANLPPDDETRLLIANSTAFKTVLAGGAAPRLLQELKLLVALRDPDEAPWPDGAHDMGLHGAEELDFIESMAPLLPPQRTSSSSSSSSSIASPPRSLAAPSVAQNLRVLSLYARDYWGWFPKLDFRLLSGGGGGGGDCFPNLRVLALGCYVFSHEWQVGWVAKLGGGRLEELYLDDCPVMWRARCPGPLDAEGYPRRDVMARAAAAGWGQETIEDRDFELRWHGALEYWREHMSALRVFGMGHGDWSGASATWVLSRLSLHEHHPPLQSASPATLPDRRRLSDRVFLNYDQPPQPATNDPDTLRRFVDPDGGGGGGTAAVNVGMQRRREHALQYVFFDVGVAGGPHTTPWIERDDRRRAGDRGEVRRYEEDRERDERALRELLRAVKERRGGRA